MVLFNGGCGGGSGNNLVGNVETQVYDIDELGIPQFVSSNYIDLESIYRISKFRSGIGHDYSDDFESCRSMKHYFEPEGRNTGNTDYWSTITIYSPVAGTVSLVYEEWAGEQIRITSDEYPAFTFIIFHINQFDSPLSAGDHVIAGQQLGYHIGGQTTSDIAVEVNTPEGFKLISFFGVMTDDLFQLYQNRGVVNRAEMLITKEDRDADPLNCDGETFGTEGTLENYVYLSIN